MKKILALLVAGLTLSILVSGCGSKPAEGDNAAPNATTPKTTPPPAPTDAAPGPGTTPTPGSATK